MHRARTLDILASVSPEASDPETHGRERTALTTRGSIPSTHVGSLEQAKAILRFIDGMLAGREIELSGDVSIGRRQDSTIALPSEERAVSANHCTLRRTAAGLWVVQDAGSAGGTFLNREKVRPGTSPVLRSGDVIGLGAGGPTALFSLRSSSFVGEQPPETYAVTIARVGDEPNRRRFADRPLLLIGRDRDCEIRFDATNEREVSKRHARIRYAGRCFMIEDLESKGGTLVNGVRTTSAMLRPGDIVELGSEGPKLVIEALEGVDDPSEYAETAVAMAEDVARRRSRIALLALGLVVIATTAFGLWLAGRTDAIEADLGRLGEPVAAADAPSTTATFQTLASRHAPAILFVYSKFHIEVTGIHDADNPFYSGDTYGSGFVIGGRGHAITNRHVVQPWLGDVEHAAAVRRAKEAFGADSVKIVSSVSVWPAGTEARTKDRALAFDRGFNTHTLANLRVVGFPPDHFVDVPFEDTTVEIVANDHTDLALLELAGFVGDATAIPALALDVAAPQPLDPVMSLGFPAGAALLEGTTASLSPTLGEIRKIEQTIQLSMPTYPGNSGGPVLDLEGRVIGVTTRRFGEGLGVCIPIAKVRALLHHLGVTP